MKKRPIFFVLLLSFLFISCENLLSPKDSYNNGDGKTYTITGDINIEGALPNELFNKNSTNSIARTGFPTVPKISDSDLNLSVSATNADSGSTIDGIINAEKTQYSIKLQKGKWTITVSGKKSDVVILEGSVTVVLNDEYPVEKAEKIILKPVQTTDGKGNLSLKLALDNERIICGGVKATLSSSEDSKKYIFFTARKENPASKIDLEFSDISSGTYSFNLEFYETMRSDGSDYVCENIIYILNDTVNIFDGLTTNEWSGTGYSEDKTTFTLTKEMIKSFAMTTFYVADDGNDDNEGTFFAPVRTIQKAVDKVIAMNEVTNSSEENPYKILLLSNIETSSNDSFEKNKALVNIDPHSETPLYLTISKYGDGNATIDAKRTEVDTGRVMYIGEKANVTLQNLILTGGYLTNDNGAGLYILNNNANVKIENSEISGNVIENGSGGGVYLGGGTFTMNGGAIISSDNDVYLVNGTTITVTGNLTSTDTVATITPSEYISDQQVLEHGNGVIFTDKIVNRFLVTHKDSNEWYVTVNGELQEMKNDAYGYLGRAPSYPLTTEEPAIRDDRTVVLKKVSCSIESYDNMLWIAHELKDNKIHKFDITLTNDIEIPSGKWTSPLDVPEASTIDGQGHSIIFNGGSGLFDRFHGGSIENLVLKGTINTNSKENHNSRHGGVGVLAGSAYQTTIKNVVSTVDVVDTGDGNVGGLIGYFGGTNNEGQPGSFIQNCAVYANIKSTNGTVGGLVGGTWDNAQCWQINNCIYKGNVTGGTDQGVGAIIGTHNTGRRSTFKYTWYCANTSEIVGKYNNGVNGVNFDGYGTVISKTPEQIASADAATLLNTNSDGTTNDVWKYIDGSEYPTLKTRSSE